MKRKLLNLIALSAILMLIFSSCGGSDGDGTGSGSVSGDVGSSNKAFAESTTADEVLNAALNALSDKPEVEYYYSFSIDSGLQLDEYDLSLIIDGTFEECPEFADIKDYAMYICSGKETFELQVMKAADETGAERLRAMLERRIKTVSGGDKSLYDPSFSAKIQKAETYTDGPFAILLITEDNSAAKTAISGLKK